MRRLGFVKLDQYGLLVTPDDRILSTRPAVLDDGLGGRIVGWRDGDLAAMELETWPPKPVAKRAPAITMPLPIASAPPIVKPAPLQAVTTPPATLPRLPGVAPAPFVAVIPVLPAAVPMKAVPAPIAAAAADEEMSEDEWEWVIVMARARAAAEETELAARAIPAPTLVAAPTPAPARRTRLETVPPPIATPVVAAPVVQIPTKKFVTSATLPGIAPIAALAKPITQDAFSGERDPWLDAKTQVEETTQVTTRAVPRAASPRTIIPVPRLVSAARSIGDTSWMQPVVRKTAPTSIQSAPRRFPQGTGPINPAYTAKKVEQSSRVAVDDQTVPNLPLPSVRRLATRG